jgi:hypothetical protein
MKILQINEKHNSRAKNHCNRKIALLSILIQLNSFVTTKFIGPQPKNPGVGQFIDSQFIDTTVLSTPSLSTDRFMD